jgi:hypothetical protein
MVGTSLYVCVLFLTCNNEKIIWVWFLLEHLWNCNVIVSFFHMH